MATELLVDSVHVKRRSPWAPVLLGLVTLGIYNLFWYYYINRELRDFGAARNDPELAKVQPAVSVLAVTLGALIIVPAIVSWFRTVGRIRRSELLVGVPPLDWAIVIILYVVGILFVGIVSLAVPYLMQDHLNKTWEAAGAVPRIPATAA